MNGLKEQNKPTTEEINITIHFVDGDTFVQPFPIDYADSVQNFMDWLRKPGKDQVWAWHVLQTGQIHMFHHKHIMAVDIDGYWEPDGRDAKWYERWMDWIRARWRR